MTEANATRGELSLSLGGAEFVLRPSYEAIVALEAKTETGLKLLAFGARVGTLPLAQAEIIVAECVKAHGRAIGDKDMEAVKPAKIGSLMLDAGLNDCYDVLRQLLEAALTGGFTAQGERKPQVTKSVTPTDT
jgi:hypothetical protein